MSSVRQCERLPSPTTGKIFTYSHSGSHEEEVSQRGEGAPTPLSGHLVRHSLPSCTEDHYSLLRPNQGQRIHCRTPTSTGGQAT